MIPVLPADPGQAAVLPQKVDKGSLARLSCDTNSAMNLNVLSALAQIASNGVHLLYVLGYS